MNPNLIENQESESGTLLIAFAIIFILVVVMLIYLFKRFDLFNSNDDIDDNDPHLFIGSN